METLQGEFVPFRAPLAAAAENHNEFRRILSDDRRVERAFFNFKNDRATRAIEEWAREQGLE